MPSKEIVVDACHIIAIGNSGFTSTEANFLTTKAVQEELLTDERVIPSTITILGSDRGPAFSDFQKEEEFLYSWTSTDGILGFQLLRWEWHRKALCEKHDAFYQFSIIDKDLPVFLCREIVEKADFSILNSVLINPLIEYRTSDCCLIDSINKLKAESASI